jgi:hypothetical protein
LDIIEMLIYHLLNGQAFVNTVELVLGYACSVATCLTETSLAVTAAVATDLVALDGSCERVVLSQVMFVIDGRLLTMR